MVRDINRSDINRGNVSIGYWVNRELYQPEHYINSWFASEESVIWKVSDSTLAVTSRLHLNFSN